MNMEAKERVEADRENFEIGRQWVKKQQIIRGHPLMLV